MLPTLKYRRFLSPDAFDSLSPDADLFRFCSADATDAINPEIHFFFLLPLWLDSFTAMFATWTFGKQTLIPNCREWSIYLTMTKTKTCTPKKDNNIQDLDKREEPDYEKSEKMRRSWRKVSGRAGGGGGNGVAATTSFPVSGIMPPAPPAARLQSQKNSTNPKIATHSSLAISYPYQCHLHCHFRKRLFGHPCHASVFLSLR